MTRLRLVNPTGEPAASRVEDADSGELVADVLSARLRFPPGAGVGLVVELELGFPEVDVVVRTEDGRRLRVVNAARSMRPTVTDAATGEIVPFTQIDLELDRVAIHATVEAVLR